MRCYRWLGKKEEKWKWVKVFSGNFSFIAFSVIRLLFPHFPHIFHEGWKEKRKSFPFNTFWIERFSHFHERLVCEMKKQDEEKLSNKLQKFCLICHFCLLCTFVRFEIYHQHLPENFNLHTFEAFFIYCDCG